jgi:hypothetical protein
VEYLGIELKQLEITGAPNGHTPLCRTVKQPLLTPPAPSPPHRPVPFPELIESFGRPGAGYLTEQEFTSFVMSHSPNRRHMARSARESEGAGQFRTVQNSSEQQD